MCMVSTARGVWIHRSKWPHFKRYPGRGTVSVTHLSVSRWRKSHVRLHKSDLGWRPLAPSCWNRRGLPLSLIKPFFLQEILQLLFIWRFQRQIFPSKNHVWGPQSLDERKLCDNCYNRPSPWTTQSGMYILMIAQRIQMMHLQDTRNWWLPTTGHWGGASMLGSQTIPGIDNY